MRKSDIPVLSVLKLLSFFVSFMSAALASALVIRFAVLFVELNFVSASILRMIVLFGVSMGLWFFISYKEGYRNGFFCPGESLAAIGIAAAVHLAVSALVRFNPWVSGATRHISGFLSLGSAYNAEERIEAIPFIAGLLTAIFTACAMAALGLFAEYVGSRRRLADRAALTGETDK